MIELLQAQRYCIVVLVWRVLLPLLRLAAIVLGPPFRNLILVGKLIMKGCWNKRAVVAWLEFSQIYNSLQAKDTLTTNTVVVYTSKCEIACAT